MSEKQSTKRVYRTAQTMYPLVEQWLALGDKKELKGFCQRADIAPHVFRYWISRYESASIDKVAQKEKGGFVALQVGQRSNEQLLEAAYEIKYPNGICLRIHRSVGLSELHSLLRS